MLAVGILCVIFCFLYTTLFSRAGSGIWLVLVFFGIVPVGFTFFLQTGYLEYRAPPLPDSGRNGRDCLLMDQQLQRPG